jgi:hypothetical protein
MVAAWLSRRRRRQERKKGRKKERKVKNVLTHTRTIAIFLQIVSYN